MNNINEEERLKANISQGILKQLEYHDLNQKELADILKVDKSTVGKWINKLAMPRMGAIQSMADYFGVGKSYFLEGETKNRRSVRINVYGSIPAGIPLEAIEDIQGWEEIPSEWTRGGKQYIALIVKGDSMYPKYLEGDVVIIQVQPDCENGQDCACYVNGYNATLKRIEKGANQITLTPINPNYAPQTYRHPGEVTIIGAVKEIRRKV